MKRAPRHGDRMHGQLADARAELSDLQAQIGVARRLLEQDVPSELVAVNEHLVCSAMHALREAEDCRLALIEAAHVGQLDVLTQLPNRAQMTKSLANAIASAKRGGDGIALLYIDLNNFKQANDTHGHAVGDELLKLVAQRLCSSIRQEDAVSRQGGDEFLVLLTRIRQPSEAVAIASKLLAAIGAEYVVAAGTFVLGASIGISLFPQDGSDAGQLIARADLAMYQAKRCGAGIGIAGRARPDRDARSDPLRSPIASTPDVDTQGLHLRLQEANEQLLLAALSSQELASAAEKAHRQQRDHFAVVAHELRSPLSPIRMAAALLHRMPPEELPRMQSIIEREVVHMTRLIGDLLDLSRVDTGKLRLERRLIDVEKIVEEAIDITRPAIAGRHQQVSSRTTGLPVMAYADPMRLAQVFRNLLDNASKYTPDGGEISVEVSVLGHTAQIAVSDTGIGITPEALPGVFEPFAQDAHAIGFNGFGLGIGLTVVRELVESHNGTVVASSEGTGRGSRFVVTLPLSGGDNDGSPPGLH